MNEVAPTVKCASCDKLLDEGAISVAERAPCPSCGSLGRAFEVSLASSLSFHSKLGLKVRAPGAKEPHHEQVTGDDLFRLTGQWNVLHRIIDRTKNYYFEIITDPRAGAIIRYCEEPLTDHLNRGSAKKRGKSDA